MPPGLTVPFGDAVLRRARDWIGVAVVQRGSMTARRALSDIGSGQLVLSGLVTRLRSSRSPAGGVPTVTE
ncbi:hypothetical protein [Streptomyces silaceus]|uniref:hypothetical protein n=1 Tax=Streptomyces silaceus TaxID=545123 RepID=UPI001FC9C830|nr:hypothetical protein [Streptomyces silaceus]